MFKVAAIIAIRPDFIRTSEVLRFLDEHDDVDLTIIHTGQHYDENLNSVFFKELNIPGIDFQLDTRGKNHNEQHSKLILQLSDALEEIKPDACVFLGDANAVVGCVAPLKLGIPIVHIEGCMRSFDWDMPEEKNRVLIDHVSDVIYAYQHEYKVNGVMEGLNPSKIVVTGNVIIDVLEKHKGKFEWRDIGLGVSKGQYALMTLHRNEHMNVNLAQQIIENVGACVDNPVVLIEMPRLKALGLTYPDNFIVTPPLGFFDFCMLEKNARIEFTDSGTNQECASHFGTPCVVTRKCTERPECRECNTTFLSGYLSYGMAEAARKALHNKHNKNFSLGDGKSSQRIVDDLVERLESKFDLPTYKYKHIRMG